MTGYLRCLPLSSCLILMHIRKTCPCNVYPLEPHFLYTSSKTGVCRAKSIFLIFAPKHRLWVFVRTASPMRFYRVPTIYVLSKNKQKYQNFSAENFQFLKLKNNLIAWARFRNEYPRVLYHTDVERLNYSKPLFDREAPRGQ